ncbi:hypothetical protein [Streptomyces sp. NL15-2K]|uniref:hypothetical protein n=1 Tax=Streptomyces sp. NL15-2K TaxID=376149 RepID=UPI000F5723D9|nr:MULTISPECIES: hypothetical protein [Actinomycetes]WKX10388.1 hypothetical protein Q4V64_23920 [Kutzneria buriramensis]GCB48105.1 hypothetical protein SNL152K_5428 [Streptomyces sp. NL15-2K]
MSEQQQDTQPTATEPEIITPQITTPVVVEQPQTLLPPPPEAPPLPPTPPKDRRVLRAALRWTAAVVVFAAVGAATAYGITRMERTDVPGLATESDGRWDYPALTRPPLPSGSPEPFAETNKAGAHYADLRALVLPAPEGATQDKRLRGSDGWLATKEFLAEYASEERAEFRQELVDNGLRHIAARGWRTEDGTHTRIYLLHFDTAAVVDEVFSTDIAPYSSPGRVVRGAGASVFDEDFPEPARIDDVQRSVYTESKPYGAEHVRQAYLAAGDVLGVIIQSRKGTAPAVPFQQTVTLQSQLLG